MLSQSYKLNKPEEAKLDGWMMPLVRIIAGKADDLYTFFVEKWSISVGNYSQLNLTSLYFEPKAQKKKGQSTTSREIIRKQLIKAAEQQRKLQLTNSDQI